MSQITGDLLIAISKSLPKAFSSLKGEMCWSVTSLEKEPTIEGEIYNIEISLLRLESAVVPFKVTKELLTKWNQHILTSHAEKYNMKGSMLANIQLNETVMLRIERYNPYQPFTVSRVESSYNKSVKPYSVFYLSAGLGTTSSAYPEFDSRYHDLLDQISENMNTQLREDLPDSVFKMIKIEVSNNWLDNSTFDPLEKSNSSSESAVSVLNKLISGVEEELDMLQVLSKKQFVNKQAEADSLRENGENVVSKDELDRYLSASSIYDEIKKLLPTLTVKVNKIKHNEAAQAVKMLSQTLVSSASVQNLEASMFHNSLVDSVYSSKRDEREEVYIEYMSILMRRLTSLLETLYKLNDSYKMFIDAGHKA